MNTFESVFSSANEPFPHLGKQSLNCGARWQNFISAGCSTSEVSVTADSGRASIDCYLHSNGRNCIHSKNLGIQKNNILGLLFLMTKEKNRKKEP